MALAQTRRLFHFDSPLEPGQLLVNSFAGTEGISRLFRFDLELVSEDAGIHPSQILGKNVTVGIRQRDGSSFRNFNGYINWFAPVRHDGRLAYYRAELVPWLWFLTLTRDCQIFQRKTVVQIIEKIFETYGLHHYSTKDLRDQHAEWENCCQYRETAFAFVSRLMEAEGIYYYFRHEPGKHTLILADHLAAHVPCEYQSAMRYEHDAGTGVARTEDTIFTADLRRAVTPNRYAHKDYNFELPEHQLYYRSPAEHLKVSDGDWEVYDYPGEFERDQDAPDWGMLREQEQEASHTVATGTGNCRSMTPGFRFDLAGHDRPDQNLNYLVTEVTHHAHEGSFGIGSDAGEASYTNTFTAIPSSIQFRPMRETEKAQMLGSQTATVVGPAGEEIYTDEYGRIKVQFHWDRKGKRDENSSCWIRVMQPIAGDRWGHIWLPRIGQEVIVDFLEGDPDRPIVTGCLYNAQNHPPYPLPDKKNWSGIKTRSTKGGAESNFNELRFVDTRGDELLALQAERDLELKVKRDATETVGRDHIEWVERDRHTTIQRDGNHEVGRNFSLLTRGDTNEKTGGNFLLEAGGDVHIKAGGQIILDAAKGTVFLGTASFINVNEAGVTIQGPMVWVNCEQAMPPGALNASPQKPAIPAALDLSPSNSPRSGETSPPSPDARQPRFLSTMRQYENNEYQQYVKSDGNLYSRKTVREIHQSLREDPNSGPKEAPLPIQPPGPPTRLRRTLESQMHRAAPRPIRRNSLETATRPARRGCLRSSLRGRRNGCPGRLSGARAGR